MLYITFCADGCQLKLKLRLITLAIMRKIITISNALNAKTKHIPLDSYKAVQDLHNTEINAILITLGCRQVFRTHMILYRRSWREFMDRRGTRSSPTTTDMTKLCNFQQGSLKNVLIHRKSSVMERIICKLV